ncbi:MAG: DUF1648 domain-containing protein [bacterium]|jgi:uncharacterized membrane protein
MRTRFLNLALLAALLVGSALAYPRLPDRIPGHFGLDGTPTRWVETSPASWFLLPLIALGLNLLLYAMAALATRDARFVNLPGKERLLALPIERQREVLRRVREGMDALMAPTTLAFCLIQLAIYRSAIGMGGRVEIIAALLLVLLGSTIGTISLLVRTQAELDRQVRLEHEAAMS